MKLRKTPRTRRIAKAARNRKRERDGMIGQWNFVTSTNANYTLDTSIDTGDIITISNDSGSNMSITVSDIPRPKNTPCKKKKSKTNDETYYTKSRVDIIWLWTNAS